MKKILLIVLLFIIKQVNAQLAWFSPPTNFAINTGPTSVITADFNGDGLKDLATADYNSNYVSILIGTGTGSFGAVTNYTTGLGAVSVISADFNGDGKADMAVVNTSSNDLSILLGTGTGSFGAATNFAVAGQPSSVTCADFN